MRDFALDCRFRLITTTFHPVQHLYTTADQIESTFPQTARNEESRAVIYSNARILATSRVKSSD